MYMKLAEGCVCVSAEQLYIHKAIAEGCVCICIMKCTV